MSTILTAPGASGGAQELPPFSDTVLPKVLGTLTTFLCLAIIIYSLRILSRLRVYREIGLDDYAISIALVRPSSPLPKS
jgi:hypothetical protein